MNRRDRRRMEKQLGIQKHKKGLPRNARFELLRQNIEEGKKKQDEMKENRRLQENREEDRKQSIDVASKATELMIKEGLSYVDALEKANELAAEEN